MTKLTKKQECPPIGAHIETILEPSVAFNCAICDKQQPCHIGSSRTLFPICDVCLSKLKVLLANA